MLAVIFFLSKKLFFIIFPNNRILYDTLSLHELFTYFPFFVYGIIVSSNKEYFKRITNHKYISAIILISFTVITLIRILIIPQCQKQIANITDPLLLIINGFLGITIIFNLFQKHENSFSSQTIIGKSLQYIGRRTLDIYLLHYFLLPDMWYLTKYLNTSSTVIGLFIGIGVSLMVITVCLIISNTIRLSPLLGKILFGVKEKQNEKTAN